MVPSTIRGQMKSRSRSRYGKQHSRLRWATIRRSAVRLGWPPGPDRSLRNVARILIRANTRVGKGAAQDFIARHVKAAAPCPRVDTNAGEMSQCERATLRRVGTAHERVRRAERARPRLCPPYGRAASAFSIAGFNAFSRLSGVIGPISLNA